MSETDILSVMFVDDDATLLDSLRRAYRQTAGKRQMIWTPLFATSVKGALAQMAQTPCAALVTDLAMPGQSGYNLILKINDQWPDIPCLMLSGTADMADAMNLINTARIFKFFVKPTDTKVLFAAVEDAVAHWQQAQRPEGQGTIDVSLAALDRLSVGILVLSPEGSLVHGNQAAMAVLKDAEALFLDAHGVVRAKQTESTHRLATALAHVSAESEGDSQSVMVQTAEAELALVAHLSALPDQSVMMMLIDPQKQTPPTPAALKATFDLTPSEARLAQHLALGLGLDEAAENAGVTLESGRTYLKRIFRKTQTSRQSELVRLLVLSAQG